jgi:hypothetical protein
MLYETLQNQQQAQTNQPQPAPSVQQAQANQPQPAPSVQQAQANQPQTPISPSTLRCPNCKTELNRPAPYCPHCGAPLNNPPNPPRSQAGQLDPGPRQSSRSAPQNISDEATMLIPPGIPPQEPSGSKRQAGASSVKTSLPRNGTNGNLPTLRAARQHMLKTSSQPVPIVRPEQNASATNSASVSASTQPNTYAAVKPFMAASSVSANGPIQTPAHLTAAANSSMQSTGLARKLAISVAIIVAVLIIVMLLLVVFLRSNHIIGSDNSTHHTLSFAYSMLARFARA